MFNKSKLLTYVTNKIINDNLLVNNFRKSDNLMN